MADVISIRPSKPKTKWVAVEPNTNNIISEGVKPESVIKKAEKSGKSYAMVFIPKENTNYVF
ncbi:MAG: hypothetical protein MI975_19985 [Cytophagales bacterium]|nr:hypothetical protein [Cytophagales bacterium]